MPRFIITGFTPFLEHRRNPSWEVAQSMARALEVQPYLLDVTFEQAASFAHNRHEELPHANLFFIHIGLAASRQALSFEARAQNLRGTSPDNSHSSTGSSGDRPTALVADAAPNLETRFDLEALVKLYNDRATVLSAPLPGAQVSLDCGDYVCNALYFHTLMSCTSRKAAEALFIHIPPLEPAEATRLGTVLAEIAPFLTLTYIT